MHLMALALTSEDLRHVNFSQKNVMNSSGKIGRFLELGTRGGWSWLVGVEITPTADFLLLNLFMDTLGDIKAIHRGKGHEMRW